MVVKKLTWDDRNSGILQEDGFRIYKQAYALGPMDTASLPEPLADLDPDTTYWEDEDQLAAYYIVAAYKGGEERYSEQVLLTPEYYVSKMSGAIIVKATPTFMSKMSGAIVVAKQPLTEVSVISGAAFMKTTEAPFISKMSGAVVVTRQPVSEASVISGAMFVKPQ